MNKRVFCFLMVLCMGWVFPSRAAEQGKEELPLVFEKTEADLGEMHQGEKSVMEFPFRNQSAHAVNILRIKPSCHDCTMAEADHCAIPPGGRGVVTVSFDSGEKKGKFTERVYVVTDTEFGNSSEQRYLLQFSSHIKGNVYLSKDKLTMDSFVEGQENSIQFSIFSFLKKPMNITTTKAYPQNIKVEKLEEKPCKDGNVEGKEMVFKVSFPPDFQPPSLIFPVTIDLATDNAKYPLFRFGITANVRRKVMLAPLEITAECAPKSRVERTIELSSPENLPLEVVSKEVRFGLPCEVKVEPEGPASKVKLHITMQSDKTEIPYNGEIAIRVKVNGKMDDDSYGIPLLLTVKGGKSQM